MALSKKGYSLGFWIVVICTTFSSTPFELPYDNQFITMILPFFAMLSLFFLAAARGEVSVSVRSFLWPLALFAMILLANAADPTYFAISLAVLAPLMMLSAACLKSSKSVLSVIDHTIALNLFFFALQVSAFLLTGTVIAFHEIIFPFSNSRVGEFVGFVRLGGLHNEPGTYSAFVFALVVARQLLGGSPSDRVLLFSGASIFLTFSAWGLVAGSIVILFAILSRTGHRLSSMLLYSVFLAAFLSFGLASYFGALSEYTIYRFDTSLGSASYRLHALEVFVDELSTYFLIGRSFAEPFCAGCISPQDLGVFSQIIVRLGLLTGFMIIVCSIWMSASRSFLLAILVFFFFTGKYDLGDSIVWFVLGLALTSQARAILDRSAYTGFGPSSALRRLLPRVVVQRSVS